MEGGDGLSVEWSMLSPSHDIGSDSAGRGESSDPLGGESFQSLCWRNLVRTGKAGTEDKVKYNHEDWICQGVPTAPKESG